MQIAMIPLLSELEDKPFEERPVLYACESPVSDSAHGRGGKMLRRSRGDVGGWCPCGTQGNYTVHRRNRFC